MMTKTKQRKQLREIAKSLRWNHKIEVCLIYVQHGDVWPYPISEVPLIEGVHDFYLSGYRREGFGENAYFWLEDHINLKLTEKGIEAA